MNVEKIRKKLTGGFQPFVIRTSGGREFKVPQSGIHRAREVEGGRGGR
jgi:hypothetical protein